MHANMIRTYTAPNPGHPRLHTSNSQTNVQHAAHDSGSQHSAHSQSLRASDSTQNTSNSTLFGPSNPATITRTDTAGSGTVTATDNVINRTADKEAGLFQSCVALRARLAGVPGFEEQVLDVEENVNEDLDPVMLLWQTFRRGFPLMMIYNALQPDEPLTIDEAKFPPPRRPQIATYKFISACITKLKISDKECFIVSDLIGSNLNDWDINMSGFSKVVKVVNTVVDMLVKRGLLESFDNLSLTREEAPRGKRTHRQWIIDEIVSTERTYVQHLELLQAFSKHVSTHGIINGDAVHRVFLNLDALLEFQRRFLVRVEHISSQPEDDQNWGRLFYTCSQPSENASKDFRVYEPYISNQTKCEQAALQEFDKLKNAGGSNEFQQMVESPTIFSSFLLKPFQRLPKYPLLLKQLLDKGDLDEKRKADLQRGIDGVNSILSRANALIDREHRLDAVKDLKSSVEDWKHHRVEAFGELLLYGVNTVIKGDQKQDSERETNTAATANEQYRMYLFEKILLCCKEVNPNKPKNKVRGVVPNDKKGKLRLQLKGRIFMQNVTNATFTAVQGAYTCKIFWRGDENIESFTIKFPSEEILRKWETQIQIQRQVCQDQARANNPNASDTNFTYNEQVNVENPYRQDDAYEDDDGSSTAVASSHNQMPYSESSHLAMSRNGSSTSLRSRSTTNDSLQPRAPRPSTGGGPMPPLAVRTGHQGNSPMERNGPSYFSPSIESPMSSSRTSGSSQVFNSYPRQQPGFQGGYHREDSNRFTAPADSSGLPRDAQGNVYPPGYSYSSTMARHRSVSNPDMQVPRRGTNNAPPVPSVPQHLVVNRSNNNSPMSPNGRRQGPAIDQDIYNLAGQHGSDESNLSFQTYDSYQQTSGILSPSIGSPEPMYPSQLKVKVKVPKDAATLSLIVPFNISCQSLKDRIEAKLQRVANVSLLNGDVKLQYLYDDEYVSIHTDEDVQTAFETWKEEKRDESSGMGEIELYCH